MKMKWRLLPLMEARGAEQMGVDEAILMKRAEDKVPNTLRFYIWKPAAVSLGYFQSVEQEVNLDELGNWNVDLVRRITGGGAVFHDRELTYSLVVEEKEVPEDIHESYHFLCGALVSGLQQLGLKAEFREINDVLVNKKKISGNAQTRRKGVVLQHGTLLLDINLRKMFSLLKISEEKWLDKAIKKAEDRVTSLRQELGREISLRELSQIFTQGFEGILGVNFSEGTLTPEEKKLARELYRKYSSKEWTFKR